jgi:hypothetical protein
MDLCFDTAGTDEEQPSPVKPHIRRQNSNGKNVNTGVAGDTPKEVWTISPRSSPGSDQAQRAHAATAAAAASSGAPQTEGMGLFLKLGSARDEEPRAAAGGMSQQNPAKRRRMDSSHPNVGQTEGSALRWSVTSGMRGDTPMPRTTHAAAAAATGQESQATCETVMPGDTQRDESVVPEERCKQAGDLQQRHHGDSSSGQTG